jgi:zinc protease
VRIKALLLIAGLIGAILASSPPSSSAETAPTFRILPNGLRVVVQESPGLGLVAVAVLVGASPRVEEPSEAGISILLRETMLRGTERRTGEEIAGALEGVGGSLVALTGPDHTEWTTLTRPQDLEIALELLADLFTNARLDPADIEAQRRRSLVRLSQQREQPQARAVELSNALVYHLHPYRNPLLGTPETLRAITREHLLRYYRAYYTAPNMVVGIAGDVRAPVAIAKLFRAFAKVRVNLPPRPLRTLPGIERALMRRPVNRIEVREEQRTAAAWVAISYLGVPVGHPDWAPLRVLVTVLGSGLSSRLFLEVRERRGLAYSVGAGFPTLRGPAAVTLLSGVDPARVQDAVEAMLGEVAKLRTQPLSKEELEAAKNRVIGLHSIDHEDLRRRAFYPAWFELLGVGYAFDVGMREAIGRVTAADVQRVAHRYLLHPAIAVVAPPGR